MSKTKIEWATHSWSPVTGCSKVSEGCRSCYAERMARRLAGRYGYPEVPHHFDVTLHPDRLFQPLHWRKPRSVFVCSMSDIFHEDIGILDSTYIRDTFAVMALSHRHTFLLLTKRPHIAKRMLTNKFANDVEQAMRELRWMDGMYDKRWHTSEFEWPLPNVWGMVTVESQDYVWRIEKLLKCPFVVRGVSVEPMLGPIDLCFPESPTGKEHPYLGTDSVIDKLDWVIAGGESGPGARPLHPDWARDLRDQCQTARVKFFFKQWGAWKPIGDFNLQNDTYHYSWQHAKPYRRVVSVGLDGKMYNNDYPPRGGWHMARVGKKAAGRSLDGREWNEFPN